MTNEPSAGAPLRVVLADDHELVRAGFEALLHGMPAVQVVGSASTGAGLLELLEGVEADLVITDMAMPAMDGLEVLEKIRPRWPKLKVLVLSMDGKPLVVWQALQQGACGYLLKSAATTELELAVRTVAAGGSYLSPGVALAVAALQRAQANPLLTARQLEILKLIASGRSAREIGCQLQLSSKTIDAHRARIMNRLAIKEVAGLTLYAVREGLVGLAPAAAFRPGWRSPGI